MTEPSPIDRRRFLMALVAGVVAAGAPLPVGFPRAGFASGGSFRPGPYGCPYHYFIICAVNIALDLRRQLALVPPAEPAP